MADARLGRIESNVTDIKVTMARLETLMESHMQAHKEDRDEQKETNDNYDERITSLEGIKNTALAFVAVLSAAVTLLGNWLMEYFKT